MSRVPIDPSKLSPASAWFAARLFESLPDLVQHAGMETHRDRPEQLELRIEVPSPTGDPQRKLVIWMEDGEPSLGFGGRHTHARMFGEIRGEGSEELIATAAAILSDKFVLCYDVGGEHDGTCGVLDLRDDEALREQLTSQYSSDIVDLRSWGGSADRRVGLGDL